MTADTKNRILNVAREFIHSRSYGDVGVAEICAKAQVKKGSFYHFFNSKQALLEEVLTYSFIEMKEQLLDKAFDRRLPPKIRFERLTAMLYQAQSDIKRHYGRVFGCPFGNIALELATNDEVIRNKVVAVFNRLQESLYDTLEDGVKDGLFADIDIAASAQAMIAYLEGVMLQAKTRNDPEIIKQLLPALIKLTVPALNG